MSKAECLAYLKSHPGKHILPEIAAATGQNIETARRMMTRLWRDGSVKKEYPKSATSYIRWWV